MERIKNLSLLCLMVGDVQILPASCIQGCSVLTGLPPQPLCSKWSYALLIGSSFLCFILIISPKIFTDRHCLPMEFRPFGPIAEVISCASFTSSPVHQLFPFLSPNERLPCWTAHEPPRELSKQSSALALSTDI